MSSVVTRARSFFIALAILVGLLIPASGPLTTPASALAVVAGTELISNGGFETGDFTDWGTKDAVDPCCRPLTVATAPEVTPTEGTYAVAQGFDGCGPDTIEFWQDVSIPSGVTASLTFDWEIPFVDNSGLLARTFDIVVEPSGGGSPLLATNIYTAPAGSFASTGPMNSMVDLTAYAGSEIRVVFRTSIPECYTGPGDMQVDNVSLLAVDAEAPVVALTGNNPQTIEVGSPYTELDATVSDNVDSGLLADIDASLVNTAVVDSYAVTYDAIDAAGNPADQVVRTVNVVDTTPPVISLVGGTVNVALGSVYSDQGASATDNYDTGLVVDIDASDVDTNAVGSYDVRFDVMDSSGNPAVQLLRTVNVTDNTAPVITLIGGTQIIEFPGAYVEQGATVSDNYDTGLEAVIDASAVNTSALGVYSVKYDATDLSDNPAVRVLRTVRVVDTTAPAITLTGDAEVTFEVDDLYVESGATATDNHDTDLMVLADATGVDMSTVGMYTVFYNVVDAKGNVALTVERTVNVVDTESPVITLIGDAEVTFEVFSVYIEGGATASDNYDVGLTVDIDDLDVDMLIVGVYTVFYDVMDSNGNVAVTVERTVNVVDTEVPVITLTGDAEVTFEVGTAYSELGATATDNYDSVLTVVPDATGVDTDTVGVYTVYYDVSDVSGNAADTVSRTVNVVDTEAPVITLLGGQIDGTQTIPVYYDYVELGASISDNYYDDLEAVIDASGVDTSVVGTYYVTYNVTDPSLNIAIEVVRTVNVIDNGLPVITRTGPAEVTIEVGSPYVDEGATAQDVVDDDGILTAAIVTVKPVDINIVGQYTVTYNVKDSNNNSAAQVTRTVNVVDTTVPVITLLGSDPQVIEVGSAYVEAGASVSDNYDTGLVAVIDASAVVTGTVGEYAVTYDVTDANTNVALTVTRMVNVVDTTVPVITLLGSDPQVIEVGSAYVEAGASVSDNYDTGLVAVIDASAVVTGTVGEYAVTYDVTDANTNVALTVTRMVNVVDTTVPVITLLGSDPQVIEVGSAYVEAGASVSDNYDTGLVAVIDASAVVTGTVGEYAVTYDVTDANTNVALTVTRMVNVVDTTVPVITLLGSDPQVIEVGSAYVEAGASVSDNYDTGLVAVIDASAVVTGTVGEYAVTYDVTDANTNVALTVTRMVNVVDTTAPVITLVGDAIVTIEVGSGYIDAGATASDVGDGDLTGSIVTVNPVSPDAIAVYTVTYDVTDALTNEAVQVTRTVNVVDTTAPLVTLNGVNPVRIEVDSVYADAGATAVDLVDGDLTSSIVTVNPVNTAVVGVYLVTYNVMDEQLNAATTVVRTVNVVDTTIPVITLVGDNPQVIERNTPYTELGATASDNYDVGFTGIVIDASEVNTASVGVYVVTYNLTDANSNEAVAVERTVFVVAAPVLPSDLFTDDDGNIFEADIDWLANSGITFGCNAPVNDKFCPNNTVTRGQMAAFLHRALPGLPEVRSAIDFADDDDSVFEADIEWLYSRGITQGTSATTFSPTSVVTRGQMAAFLRRALPGLPEVRSAIDFADDDNSVFEADIEWLYSRGITQGTSATTFSPNNPVTRGQMAAFLHRALGD